MNSATFFKHFESLADQPDAVPQIRELVWQLAVQGKLLPQNPTEEPADILRKRIAAEKAVMLKAKKLKAPAAELPIRDAGTNFALPKGWAWAKLAEICVRIDYQPSPAGRIKADRGASGGVDAAVRRA